MQIILLEFHLTTNQNQVFLGSFSKVCNVVFSNLYGLGGNNNSVFKVYQTQLIICIFLKQRNPKNAWRSTNIAINYKFC